VSTHALDFYLLQHTAVCWRCRIIPSVITKFVQRPRLAWSLSAVETVSVCPERVSFSRARARLALIMPPLRALRRPADGTVTALMAGVGPGGGAQQSSFRYSAAVFPCTHKDASVCERVLQEPALGELTNWRIVQFVATDLLLVHFSDSSGISKTLTIPLDA
jgi:hypothetical protein